MGRAGRIVAGIVAGYVVIVALSTGTTALLRSFLEAARSRDPSTLYLLFDLSYALVYSAVGGWIAVRVGGRAFAGYVLAAAFFALGLWTVAAGMDPVHPAAYQWASAILGPLAVLAGGRIARSGTAGASGDAGEVMA